MTYLSSECDKRVSASRICSTNCLVASARFMRHSDKSLGWLIIDKERKE
jgi:hypothetical protein